MSFRGNTTKLIAYYKVVSKQFTLFFLMIAFINTIIFPSVLLVVNHSTIQSQLSAESQGTSSLAEYILEDYLQICDSTTDAKEEDVEDLEKLYDEVDLLHYTNAVMLFHRDMSENNTYTQDKYPLRFFCYSSPTPPPECRSTAIEMLLSQLSVKSKYC